VLKSIVSCAGHVDQLSSVAIGGLGQGFSCVVNGSSLTHQAVEDPHVHIE
jgi:hypothetical protein